jgi:hypothetical protein
LPWFKVNPQKPPNRHEKRRFWLFQNCFTIVSANYLTTQCPSIFQVNKMRTWKILTITAVVVVAAALTVASAYAYMGITAPATYTATGTAGTYGGYGGYGGMMGGRGMMGGYAYVQPQTSSQTTTPSYGRGCIGQAYAPTTPTNTATLNITTAAAIAQTYIASNPNLAVAQVEEYSQNFYAQVAEKDTGAGAFELLINKVTGAVGPEMGPNMMWTTKYGPISNGMMSFLNTTTPTTNMPVNTSAAQANAQQYLTTNIPGATTGDVTTFYGYYTIEILNNGATYGMLSVNGYTDKSGSTLGTEPSSKN